MEDYSPGMFQRNIVVEFITQNEELHHGRVLNCMLSSYSTQDEVL